MDDNATAALARDALTRLSQLRARTEIARVEDIETAQEVLYTLGSAEAAFTRLLKESASRPAEQDVETSQAERLQAREAEKLQDYQDFGFDD